MDMSKAIGCLFVGDEIIQSYIIWTDGPEGIIIENPSASKSYKGFF